MATAELGPDGQPRRKRRRRRRRGRGGQNAGQNAGQNMSQNMGQRASGAVAGSEADGGSGAGEFDGAEGVAEGEPAADDELAARASAGDEEVDVTEGPSAGEIFDSTNTFEALGLRDSVLKGVKALGFKRPTHIQARLIPAALSGRDLLGQAKTGTGKTAAFALPLLHMAQPGVPFQALVLAPTRELAIQITSEIEDLGRFTPVRAATVYGGQRIGAQVDKLKKGPPIIVGTPGRLMDMVERGHLHLGNVKFAVLDEVDRMLDIGFRDDIRRILGQCPKDRQTIFVSATISPDIEKLARQYMRDPEKLVVSAGSLTVSLVQQHYLSVQPWDKRKLLTHLLTHEEPALTLVFCRLKRTVDDVARHLAKHGIDAHAIHADLGQGKRNAVMQRLRDGRLAVLVASDLASRGIDVDGITHVVNYDLPEDIELYVHRIGRTARAGRGGVAWSFVTPDQGPLLTDIEALINAEIPRLDYPDFQPGPVPEDRRRDQERAAQRRAELSKKNRLTARPDLPLSGSAPQPHHDQPRGDRPRHEQPGGDRSLPDQSGPDPSGPNPAAAGPRQASALDPAKFPGGLVPTKLPPKRLQGRVAARR